MANIWFKAKRFGWGWCPATWQGWTIMAVWIALFALKMAEIEEYSRSAKDIAIELFIPLALMIILLLLICWGTGEKPGWRWGK